MKDIHKAAIKSPSPSAKADEKHDLVCFSHLRWDFVFQRPQHLMSRFACDRRVFFIEEPISEHGEPELEMTHPIPNLTRCVPKVSGESADEIAARMREVVSYLSDGFEIVDPILWFYTPMMIDWAEPLFPGAAVIYDCMDELSKFRFAPPELLANEARLLNAANLVFAGGKTLYEAKRKKHPNVHAFPSSIDAQHFRQARSEQPDPGDQKHLSRPRIGYAGVIDERIDLVLLDELAKLRPDVNIVMLGPVVKIDPMSLPRHGNITYLGQKSYSELPGYFAHWDIGIMPFALNESTEFISPTKTPEYLAAGLPVISTAVRDVVDPYGLNRLVRIAGSASEMASAIDDLLSEDRKAAQARADEFLADRSWDRTYQEMCKLIEPLTSLDVSGQKLNGNFQFENSAYG